MPLQLIDQITVEWLREATRLPIQSLSMERLKSNWAEHARIIAKLDTGEERRFWFKLCLHPQLGRSEVDYYLMDYVGLTNSPLVACFDGGHEPQVGYYLLLEDLSESFQDRKESPPSLDHGLAIAESLARIHRVYWEKGEPEKAAVTQEKIEQLRPGIAIMERESGRSLRSLFDKVAGELCDRLADGTGQTRLHSDLNPTNVLTPKTAYRPVYFLDRQPLDGVTPYGLATYDLAYAIAPWWPLAFRQRHETAILRCWYETLDEPDYSLEKAQKDWDLSVAQCLHVPLSHCLTQESADEMSGLWRWQLENLMRG